LDDQHKRSFVEGYEDAMKTLDAISHVPSRITSRKVLKSQEQVLRTHATKREVTVQTDQRVIVQPISRAAARAVAVHKANGANSQGGTLLPGPQQRILNSLATWKEMGDQAPVNAQVAWLAGYSPTSTSYTNPRSALSAAGFIGYPSGDRVKLMDE